MPKLTKILGDDSMDAMCSLCGALIPDDSPKESWMWHGLWPASKSIELHAHPGCHRLRVNCLDIDQWELGTLTTLVYYWCVGDDKRKQRVLEESAGCPFAEAVVHEALHMDTEQEQQ